MRPRVVSREFFGSRFDTATVGSRVKEVRQNLNSQSLLVSFTRSQSHAWTRGLLESQSRAPRQNPISQCPLVKLGLLSPEQRAPPVLWSQQPQCLLAKLGLLEA